MNSGQSAALDRGIKETTGDIVFFLDADDFFLDDKIHYMVEQFESTPGLAIVAHSIVEHHPESGRKEEEDVPKDIMGSTFTSTEILKRYYLSNKFYGEASTLAIAGDVCRKISSPKGFNMFVDEFYFLHALMQGSYRLEN